jgi:hypothetical protein
MFISDPDFLSSWILDLGSRIQQQQKRGGVKQAQCGSKRTEKTFHCTGMFIPDPHFLPSRIPDLRSNSNKKEEDGKKFVALPFFVAKTFTKMKII